MNSAFQRMKADTMETVAENAAYKERIAKTTKRFIVDGHVYLFNEWRGIWREDGSAVPMGDIMEQLTMNDFLSDEIRHFRNLLNVLIGDA